LVNGGGAYPTGGAVASGGILYGAAYWGGADGFGTIYACDLDGSGYRPLYVFTGGDDYLNPQGPLILSSNLLYGTTPATIFALTTNGTDFTNVFSSTADDFGPNSGLLMVGQSFYGTKAAFLRPGSFGKTMAQFSPHQLCVNVPSYQSLHGFACSLIDSKRQPGGNDGSISPPLEPMLPPPLEPVFARLRWPTAPSPPKPRCPFASLWNRRTARFFISQKHPSSPAPGRRMQFFYLERLIKFLLWSRGGFRVFFDGPPDLGARLARYFKETATGKFDANIMGERIYERPFAVVTTKDLPPPRATTTPLGRHWNGCRIGFDLGASDRKAAAVIGRQGGFFRGNDLESRAANRPAMAL
jgi:uncharacterized repeat protein (TIGR03803 family)